MAMKKFLMWFTSKADEVMDKEVSIDACYKEKYNEMRRHRDYQLSTVNWCTVILLAIIAGFVSINNDSSYLENQISPCGYIFFKGFVILFIWTVVYLGSIIVNHSAKRYYHMREWVSKNMEPVINGEKYKPEEADVPIQNAIIAILVFLGLLASGIVVVFYNPSNLPCNFY